MAAAYRLLCLKTGLSFKITNHWAADVNPNSSALCCPLFSIPSPFPPHLFCNDWVYRIFTELLQVTKQKTDIPVETQARNLNRHFQMRYQMASKHEKVLNLFNTREVHFKILIADTEMVISAQEVYWKALSKSVLWRVKEAGLSREKPGLSGVRMNISVTSAGSQHHNRTQNVNYQPHAQLWGLQD